MAEQLNSSLIPEEEIRAHELDLSHDALSKLGEIAAERGFDISNPWELPKEDIDVYTEDVGGPIAGRRTIKQRLAGTDIILRSQKETNLEPTPDEAAEGVRLFEELDSYPGVNVVPMRIVQGPQLYTLVKEVKGEPLPIALEHPTPELIEQYQDSLIGLTKYFVDKFQNGGRYLNDMPARHQRMYGRVDNEENPRIYLVDTDFAIDGIEPNGNDTPEREHRLLRRSEWIAWDILNTEKSNGQFLGRAREALNNSLNVYPDNDIYNVHRAKILEILNNSPLVQTAETIGQNG